MSEEIANADRSLGFVISDLSRLIRKRFDRRARALGLTRAQWRVLSQLRRREGINQTRLADVLEVEAITLGRHIDRLEESGWVERRPDPDDRRMWRIYLTEKVQPVIAEMERISVATQDDAWADIPEGDRERIIADLMRIKDNVIQSIQDDAAEDEAAQEPTPARAAGGRHG